MIITLLTDFGRSDYFVGAMKGVILSINPDVQLVDITHEIPSHNIRAGAFNLLALYKSFPSGTIHLAVVDPGVGSSRRPILVVSEDQYFIGPDNGLFSYIYKEDSRVYHLTNVDYFRHPISRTFHGRDIFAPVAAALSKGLLPSELGEPITDYIKYDKTVPIDIGDGRVSASIIHIDHFGNCITNLTQKDITDEDIKKGLSLIINGMEIKNLQQSYVEREGEDLFAIWGSAGFLEIAARCKAAANILRVECGQQVLLLKNR
jgi:S-adenosyl-L-methionine hydrolase (adenosine-forming)